MCCETWPPITFPSSQLKAHYGTGPRDLVRQSATVLILPSGMAAGFSLKGHVPQQGKKHVKSQDCQYQYDSINRSGNT